MMEARIIKKRSALSKGDRTRERIKAAVVRLVAEKGNRFVLQDVCHQANITHGGFYFHYENKEQVLVEVAQDWMKSFKTAILAVPPNENFFREIYEMLLTYVTGFAENVGVVRVVLLLDPDHPELQLVFSKYQFRWWARLEERFRQARKEQGLSLGMEIWMAHLLTESIFGLCRDTYVSAVPGLAEDGSEYEAVAERAAVLWYRLVLGSDPDPADLTHCAEYFGS